MLKDSTGNRITMIRITLLLVCVAGVCIQRNQGEVHGFSVFSGRQRSSRSPRRIIPSSNRNGDPSYNQHSTLIRAKQRQQHRWSRLRQATKDSSSRASKKSSSSQDVQEMASFLAVQFVDVLLKGALNGESVAGTAATATTETTASGSTKDKNEDEDKDLEDLFNEDTEIKTESTSSPSSSPSSSVDTEEGASTTTTPKLEEVAPKPLEIESKATVESSKSVEEKEEEQPVRLPEIPEEEPAKMERVDVDDEDEQGEVDSADPITEIQPEVEGKNDEDDVEDNLAPSTSLDEISAVNNTLSATEGDGNDEVTSISSGDAVTDDSAATAVAARIPSIISTDLGRPLEIVTSSVPPLRDTSFLSKSSSNQKSSTETSTTLSASGILSIPETSVVEVQQKAKKEQPKVDDLPPPPLTLEDTELPLSDIEQSDDVETQTEQVVIDEDASLQDSTNVESVHPINDGSLDEILIPPTQNVQAPILDDQSLQEEGPPTSPPSSSKLTTPKIAEDRFEAIVKARRQPKPPDEEASLAARYGSMSPSVRAFAVLFDLGMIDCNKDPSAPGYDHSNDDELCDQYYI